MIHHTIVGSQIHFQGGKKPPQVKDAGKPKGKGVQLLNASKAIAAKKAKTQEKGYKGRSKLFLEKMEQYWKKKNASNAMSKAMCCMYALRRCKGMKLQRLLHLKS